MDVTESDGITAKESELRVYDLFSRSLKHRIMAHQGIVHDLKWSADDEFLLSSSGDMTVKLFRTFCGPSELANQTDEMVEWSCLVHPS